MPLVGTWIEIVGIIPRSAKLLVVPLVGTWIEIYRFSCFGFITWSCPSWARGLKYYQLLHRGVLQVVPLVGTWIEMKET